MLIDSVTKRLAITLINNEKHAFLFHCTHGYRNSNIAVNKNYNEYPTRQVREGPNRGAGAALPTFKKGRFSYVAELT